jgi:hypothetical protein
MNLIGKPERFEGPTASVFRVVENGGSSIFRVVEDGDSGFLRKVGICLPDYTASYPRRP